MPSLLDLLDATPGLSVNQWRPGSLEWPTPLHQAARHHAPSNVLAELLQRGALCCLRDARQARVITHRGAMLTTEGLAEPSR